MSKEKKQEALEAVEFALSPPDWSRFPSGAKYIPGGIVSIIAVFTEENFKTVQQEWFPDTKLVTSGKGCDEAGNVTIKAVMPLPKTQPEAMELLHELVEDEMVSDLEVHIQEALIGLPPYVLAEYLHSSSEE